MPAVVGGLLLSQLALLRLVAWADLNGVTFFGREANWACSFRQHYGLPCPTCGMTRSVVLTVQGQLESAWLLNPAGAILVLGILLFGATMIYAGLSARSRGRLDARRLQRRIGIGASAYGGLFVAAMLFHWVVQILRA